MILSAFYREHDGCPTLRIYEVDGKSSDVQFTFGGDVAAAWKVNLLGDSITPLKPEHESVRLTLRPREIATLKLDLVQARKQWRNLDDSRNVWVESGKKEVRKNPK